MPTSVWLHALTLSPHSDLVRRNIISPILQLGKWGHGGLYPLAQGLLFISDKAEIQTLAMWLWLPEDLPTVLPRPSVDSMQLLISKRKFTCTCSVYILPATK